MQGHSYRQEGAALLGKPYRLSFYLWRHSPGWFRSFWGRNALTKGLKTRFRDFLANFAGREDLYSDEYYVYVDAESSRSAPTIVESVISRFSPKRVIDVGCGSGALLAEFRRGGVSAIGLEYSEAALNICRRRGLDVQRFNIEAEHKLDFGAFDVAICFEVAEHLSAEFADPLVSLLVRFAPLVIFTAAVPGQGGGADHINEQPHEYWIAKFEQRGYRLLRDLSEHWRQRWRQAQVAGFYSNNVMIFQKESQSE